jgi:hypothetical protein
MKIEVTVGGLRRIVEVQVTADGYAAGVDGDAVLLRLHPDIGSECFRLEDGWQTLPVRICATDGGASVIIGTARVTVGLRRALPIPSRRKAGLGASARLEVRAPIPGLVVAVPVEHGATVAPDTPVAIIEAMKMQMEVPAAAAGRIEDLRVRPGQEVAGGAVLAVIACLPDDAGVDDSAVASAGQEA